MHRERERERDRERKKEKNAMRIVRELLGNDEQNTKT